MLDFPNSPSVGQTYNSGSGAIYVWDGVAWSIATSQTATALSRNLIVNPCGHVSQENGQTAGTVDSYYIADQWSARFVAAGAAVSAKSDNAVVNASGSFIRLLYKTTTIKASLAAGDFAAFTTKLEGLRIQSLGYSGNTPVQSVLRFGFNGPAGIYSVVLRNPAAFTLSWIGQFTIAAGQANADTTQVLTIPSPPAGYTWATGSAAQIELWITFAAGTAQQAPGLGWQAGNFIAGPGQFNLLGTVNNQAQIWDVGLYADPNRTGLPSTFQVPDYALDFFECQRYWQWVSIQFWGNVTSGNAYLGLGKATVIPRAAPSLGSAINITNSSFPATVGAYQMFNQAGGGVSENRSANATAVGGFQSVAAVNARM